MTSVIWRTGHKNSGGRVDHFGIVSQGFPRLNFGIKLEPMLRETHLLDVAIVIPVFNELTYTINCLESLKQSGVRDSQILIVNNGSTDGTAEFLASRPEIRVIHNPENLGCGFAWNQGAKASSPLWTIVMNNDVLVAPGWLEGFVGFAEKERFDVVSPAMCEGELDYDFRDHAVGFMHRMNPVRRWGMAHGVCFMVHRRVFDVLGGFDSDPRLGGYEDDEFFRRARRAGFRLAISGAVILHHFGSVTQKSIKTSRHQPNVILGDRDYYRKKTGQTWIGRKVTQLKQAIRNAWWTKSERLRFGDTLLKKRVGGTWRYF